MNTRKLRLSLFILAILVVGGESLGFTLAPAFAQSLPDFAISASPTTITLVAGTSGSSTVTLASLNGFVGTILLSTASSGPGVTVTLSPISVILTSGATGTSTLTISTTTGTTPGTPYPITVAGTNGTVTRAWTLTVVTAAALASPIVGRVCIIPGSSTACPQTMTPLVADGTGHLTVSVNILGSTNFNAFSTILHWDPTIMNATSTDVTSTVIPSPSILANCTNGIGLGCGTHDGSGVAHVDVRGSMLSAPVSGNLFKLSFTGLAGARLPIGFATGCTGFSFGIATGPGSVPNADSCVAVGIITTTICTTFCTETFTPVAESIQSQLLGVQLPTPFRTTDPSGNIVGTVSAGGAPNFADTWVMPYPITMPGNITSWKAQFNGGFLSSIIPIPADPTSVQLKVLRKTTSSILTVVEAGPVHVTVPVLQARLPGYPLGETQFMVIQYFTDTLLTVLPGDFVGLTFTSDARLGAYVYPTTIGQGNARIVTRNVPVNGTIDLSDPFTGTSTLTPALEVFIQPNPPKLDTARDGIPDFVKLSPEMQAFAVDPCRKNVLVQLDFMVPPATLGYTHQPLQGALDIVTRAFDTAPVPAVSNCPYAGFPKKPSGINLVLDVKNSIPQQDALNFTQSQPQSFDNLKATYMDPNRAHYFHYGIFAHTIVTGKTTSGAGEIFGSNFIVSLGGWTNNVGTVNEQAGSLMHEIGHNLGLEHGGADHLNFKPNYMSVMNYEHQVVGVVSRTSTGGNVTRFDYSGQVLPTLNEVNLDEWANLSNSNDYTRWTCPDGTNKFGLVNTSLDWNCDGQLATGVRTDINKDSLIENLTGYNDWANLQYKFTQSPNFNIGCTIHCDIGCTIHCDIGCTIHCDIGTGHLDFAQAQAIESAWNTFLATPHHSTSTTLTCRPSSLAVATSTSCAVTVTDIDGTPTTPIGMISFKSSQPGTFSPNTCTLTGTGATASCSVNYTPGVTSEGLQTITAGYTGDANHLGSNGSTIVTGLPLPPILTITTSTKLTSDVIARVVIGADGITLNCDGHTISGITTAPAASLMNNGITLNGRNGVFVLNCHVTNFYIGVQLTSSNGTFLNGNTVTGNGFGFFLSSSNLNHFATNNASLNGFDGFRLVSSNSNDLAGNTANGNSGSGFSLLSSNFNRLAGNTANLNGVDGFLLVSSTGNTLLSNSANSNGSYGFAFTSGSNNNLVQSNSACTNFLFDAFQDTTSTGNVYKNNNFCTTKGLPSKF